MGHIGAENVYYTSDTKVQKAVTDGTNGEPRTGIETKPTNLTYQLWKRIN